MTTRIVAFAMLAVALLAACATVATAPGRNPEAKDILKKAGVKGLKNATDEDFHTEWLAPVVSIAIDYFPLITVLAAAMLSKRS